jgi:protein subunit release factor A
MKWNRIFEIAGIIAFLTALYNRGKEDMPGEIAAAREGNVVEGDYDKKIRSYSYKEDLTDKERAALEVLKLKKDYTFEDVMKTSAAQSIRNFDDLMEVK